jgi:hypothetical protein
MGIKSFEHPRGESRGVGHLQVVDHFLRFFWRLGEVLERAVNAVNALQAELHALGGNVPPFLAVNAHEENHVLHQVEINFRIFYGDAPVPKELTKGLAA